MTDTEAKALALVNEICGSSWLPHEIERIANFKALCRYIEATEARHAEELRELKERFSEAVEAYGRLWSKRTPSRDEYTAHFAPFILSKPDPLVEAWRMAFPGNHIEDARDECAKISAAIEKRGGKIVWEAGE